MRVLFLGAKLHTIEPFGIMSLSPYLKRDGHAVRLMEAGDAGLHGDLLIAAFGMGVLLILVAHRARQEEERSQSPRASKFSSYARIAALNCSTLSPPNFSR